MDTKEYTEMVRTLSNRYLEEYSRGVQQCTSLLNDIAKTGNGKPRAADIGSAEFQRRYTAYLLNDAPRLLGRLSEAGLEYYSAVSRLGLQALTDFVDRVMQSEPGVAGAAGAAGESAALVFHGVRGEDASNAFLVTNNRSEAIDVAFDIAEVRSEDGEVRFKPKARFSPTKCRLAPHARQVVQCSISLTERFAQGQVHRGSIVVDGLPDMAMPFEVEVEELPAKAATRPKAAGSAKKAAKKKPKKAAGKKAAGRKTGS